MNNNSLNSARPLTKKILNWINANFCSRGHCTVLKLWKNTLPNFSLTVYIAVRIQVMFDYIFSWNITYAIFNEKILCYDLLNQTWDGSIDVPYRTHLSTAVAWREKKSKHFVFNKYFFLILGVLKSKISKKSFEPFLRKLDFKLIHYKARVQPVGKITTIATRNRCSM